MRISRQSILYLFLFCLSVAPSVHAQQKMDKEYAKKIKEATTSSEFLNEMVDHLPASDDIPSPLDFFGTIAGAPDTLHYSHQVYEYMRALADASPRVMVRTIGKTEEDREMIEVFIADEATINNLQTYRGYLNDLSDPRQTDQEKADDIIAKAKPIYYLTAGLHSPETGSPEMVMELTYRLAVEDSPRIKKIRDNVITAISPVTEPDGRDRVVDVYHWRSSNENVTPNLTYWGHYAAHDNNRDAYGLGLNLTRNILDTYLYWKPTVMHDLHESVPFLYVQTGKGPYNPYFDATLIDEWNKLAYNDVDALTRRDMPGVWTWGFFNGWAGNYLIWIANNRNSVGRFYETFGNHIPQTVERNLDTESTSQEWYRMNPPLEKTMWSLRDNVNYSQTGVLSSLSYTADHPQDLLENFYYRSQKSIKTGKNEAPYAFVIPKDQARPLATARLINLLRRNGIEVSETNKDLTWSSDPKKDKKEEKKNDINIKGGAYVMRMDQPYRTLVGLLLDQQEFPDRYDPPYDDVGWTLPYLYQVKSYKVADASILDDDMKMLHHDIQLQGNVSDQNGAAFIINNSTDDQVALFRLRNPDVKMYASEETFQIDGKEYAAGSIIINGDDLSGGVRDHLLDDVRTNGVDIAGATLPDVVTHELDVPRIALVHTWIPTPQRGGWWRLAFDKLGVPYDYISTQDFSDIEPDDYDVIIMPDNPRTTTARLVQGSSQAGPAIPWMKTEETPNLGLIDETADQRRGMGEEGVANLRKFIERGGVLISEANSTSLPIDVGITRNVSIKRTSKLETHGSIFKAEVTDKKSPIMYGYADTLGVYFNEQPVFIADSTVGGEDDYMTPDWLKDERWQKEYPRVVMRFSKDPKNLLMSGMLKGANELAGTPAIIDVPVQKGHVVMFANHPFWRWQTHGSHSLVFNTILNWNDLHAGWPERPTEKEDEE